VFSELVEGFKAESWLAICASQLEVGVDLDDFSLGLLVLGYDVIEELQLVLATRLRVLLLAGLAWLLLAILVGWSLLGSRGVRLGLSIILTVDYWFTIL